MRYEIEVVRAVPTLATSPSRISTHRTASATALRYRPCAGRAHRLGLGAGHAAGILVAVDYIGSAFGAAMSPSPTPAYRAFVVACMMTMFYTSLHTKYIFLISNMLHAALM